MIVLDAFVTKVKRFVYLSSLLRQITAIIYILKKKKRRKMLVYHLNGHLKHISPRAKLFDCLTNCIQWSMQSGISKKRLGGILRWKLKRNTKLKKKEFEEHGDGDEEEEYEEGENKEKED